MPQIINIEKQKEKNFKELELLCKKIKKKMTLIDSKQGLSLEEIKINNEMWIQLADEYIKIKEAALKILTY